MSHHEDIIEPWKLVEHGFERGRLGRSESLFALGNGHLGLRGNLDEGEPRALTGTYLNGFYESYPLEYGERGYGFPEDGQTIIDVADGKIIRLLVENEPVDVERGYLEEQHRELDFRDGLLRREMTWRSDYGHRVKVKSERMVSFVQRSVAAIHFEVEALDQPLRIALQSNLVVNQPVTSGLEADPRAGKALGAVLEPRLHLRDEQRCVLAHTTRRTNLSVATGMDHIVEVPADHRVSTDIEENLGRVTVSVRLQPGQKLKVTKFLAYHWSSRQTVEWLRDQVDASLENALGEGWDGLAAGQRKFLDEWWERADIELDGDPRIQQALRFALFHLIQCGARIEGLAIPAKGLTGTGYDGHAFWDSETFVLPVMTYIDPQIARDALEWRADTLPLATERAQQLGLAGAVLPWRTIHGEECSGYWPAGQAAMHVNADVADAVRRYVQVSGDQEFARGDGLDLLVHSARLWISLGFHDRDDRFRISGVTGPDEYSALVDDNVFTNLMAQTNLRTAAEFAECYVDEANELGVDDTEIGMWREAADAMYLPYDEELGIHPQDDGFFSHAEWDWDKTAVDDYPLLLNHPYFELYRRQVIKQADLVLALWLRSDAFTDEQKRRAFEYYERITVRDSSLSACVQAVIAAEVGHLDLAWAYLSEAALTDIDDLHHNTHNGLHMASLAGAVSAAIAGLGGFRDHGKDLVFNPRVPGEVNRLAFRLTVRGSRLRVTLVPGEARYHVEDGDPLEIVHWGQRITVDGGERCLPLPEPPQVRPPEHPPGRAPGAPTPSEGPDPTSAPAAAVDANGRLHARARRRSHAPSSSAR